MKRGTLFTVLGLVLLLGIVAGLANRVFRREPHPTVARIHGDFAVILDALERYRADGKPVPEEAELDFLVPDYLPDVPEDPWGRPYRYSSNGREFFLVTFGRDGERGGHTEEEDHSNHDGHPQPPPAPQAR